MQHERRIEPEELEPHHSPYVRIALEPWQAIWPAVETLALAHGKEVEPSDSPRRIKLDPKLFQAMSDGGFLRIYTLRLDGVLSGYLTWQLMMDPESEGLPIAMQGAWYVLPRAPWGSAAKLFTHSLEDLRSVGVKCCFPHHRMLGRGRGLDKFFRSLGAVKIQDSYQLWLGD